MNEQSEKIINRTEELFIETVDMDVDITRDRLSYITWLTAIAASAITFSLSGVSLSNNEITLTVAGVGLYDISVLLFFFSIITGVVAKYQGHQTLYLYRMIAGMAKMQRYPFYRKVMEEDPITFNRKYFNCGYLNNSRQEQFKSYQRKTKRWYGESNLLILQASTLIAGYGGIAFVLLKVQQFV